MKTKILKTLAGFPLQEAIEIEVTYNGKLGDTTSNSYWVLSNDEGQIIATGNTLIPEEIHSQWGTDDNVPLDYILEQLGLTKLETTLD
jgi:hypothetical protein